MIIIKTIPSTHLKRKDTSNNISISIHLKRTKIIEMSQIIKNSDPDRITFNINSGLKKKLKIAAVKKRQSMTDFLISLLEDKFNKIEK